MNNPELLAYYARRAHEYERIYQKPERQTALERLKAHLTGLLTGHDVLEIACGTGYWTAHLAPATRLILATDAVAEVLSIARSKTYPPGRVRFACTDAYALDVPAPFSAAFAGFWWSHIPRANLSSFLNTLHRTLQPGGRVVFFDNQYVEGSSTPISEADDEGNTYQIRRLADGTRHRVLKNFPTATELRRAVADTAQSIHIADFTYYWCLSYTLDGAVGDPQAPGTS